MSDTSPTGTEPGTNSGNPGSGAPNDAPAGSTAPQAIYTQEQFDTASAKTRRAVAAETATKRDREWLEKLGVTSMEEALAKLAAVEQPKPKKTDAEQLAEKMQADFARKLAEKDTALAAAQKALAEEAERRNQEQLRSFLLAHVADTTNPALAMALFGVPFKAQREIRIANGVPVVVEDGTELPHVKPDDWVKELLAKPEFAFLRKPTVAGGGTRPGAAPAPHSAPASTPPRKLSRNDEIAEVVRVGMASVSGANGGR